MSDVEYSLALGQLAQYVLLTPDQAAALCQVSRGKFDSWTTEPGFPVLRGPHFVRIHREELTRWLAARAVETNSHRPAPSVRQPASIDARR